MQARQATRGKQAQARACLTGLGGAAASIEALEQVGDLLVVGPAAAAAHRQVHSIRHALRLDPHWLRRVAVQQRIAQQGSYSADDPLSIPGADTPVRNIHLD